MRCVFTEKASARALLLREAAVLTYGWLPVCSKGTCCGGESLLPIGGNLVIIGIAAWFLKQGFLFCSYNVPRVFRLG